MKAADTRYAKTTDGVYLAYQTLGEGPLDIVWQPDWPGNIDFEWDAPPIGPFLRELASFSRVITHDQRGIGLSSRNVALPDLETRVADLRTVLDAAKADRVVLVGVFSSGSVNALLAATDPARVHSLVWIEPSPRSTLGARLPVGSRPRLSRRRPRDARALGHAAITAWPTSSTQASFGNELPRDSAELRSKQSRNACTPDVARELSAIWYDTDVRAILPAVRCPTLLLSREGVDDPEAAYVASLMPNATLKPLPRAPGATSTRRRSWRRSARSSGSSRRLAAWTRSWPPSCSPTSWDRPRSRRRWATRRGRSSWSAITRRCGTRSNAGTAPRSTRRATASTPRSTDPHARCDARSTSARASASSGSRSGPACTWASAR